MLLLGMLGVLLASAAPALAMPRALRAGWQGTCYDRSET